MDDFFALLDSLPPEMVEQMLYPYQQEMGAIGQEMDLAQQLRTPQGSQHVSPLGTALGGLGNAVGNVAGAYRQYKGVNDQRALGEQMQGEAFNRIKAMKEYSRQQAIEDFLRNRGNALGFNAGITNWGG
jgi:hypothetical protein